MQRYCAENPFEAGTQQSHPVNPRLAYLSRRMSHLHDYNLSSTSSSSSSSCSSPHSTTAVDESLKSEAGSAPARRHIGSHSFVPMKCGDWNKSATCIAKKKRHKNSDTER
ncbi:hypothetical protein BOX15_Mlig032947g4 [Macrostomum lignano]|nr:hypothetical protein BOX15_Mlig032947g4 [Macrostomum lignano]